jgi:DNA polymerase delta subunit 1
MKIIHEKTAKKGIFYGSKCYIIDKREKIDSPMKIEIKGLSFNKRDCCGFVAKLCKEIVNELFKDNNIQKTIKMIDDKLSNLVHNEPDWNSLTIVKKMSKENYDGNVAHVELVKRIARRTPGMEPRNGDAVYYVHIDVGDMDQKLNEADKIEEPTFAKDSNLKLDIFWYLENQIRKNVEKIFQPFYPEISKLIDKYTGITKQKHYGIKKSAKAMFMNY